MRKKSLISLSLAVILSLLLTSISYADVTSDFQNPLMRGADPTIARAADGFYYSCFAVDNDIYLKKADTVLGVGTAKSRLVWDKPSNFGYVWGPYIYRLDGKWYIYFTSGPENDFGYGHPSSYVLENTSPDPFEGTWELKGKSSNADADGQVTEKEGLLNTEGYGLACGVVTMGGKTYFTYTKYFYFTDPEDPSKTKFDECPSIVEMENPYTLTGPEGTLARPVNDWEKHGDNINEGAAVVERNGKVYFGYSASSFMNDNYCVGVSTADAGSNLLQESNWTKINEPALKKSPENSTFGPGSPLFVKSEDGSEDWLIYHGGPVGGQTGSNRWVRAQRINWNDDDSINLGIPSNPGTVLDRPSGEEKSETYEAEEAAFYGVTKTILSDSSKSSGSGVMKYNSSSDGYVEFIVDANTSGSYSLNFRYNNTTGGNIPMKLEVNQDGGRQLSFAPNGSNATNYDLLRVHNVQLNAGLNKIRLSAESANNLMLDAMITKRSVMYEAENAALAGGAIVENNHTGYSGSGFVGSLYAEGAAAEFTVNAPYAGSYSVNLTYCNGFDNIDKTLSLYVNGVKVKRIDLFSFGSWDTWSERYDNIELKKGSNTITYKYDNGDGGNVNLDYITVTEATTRHYEAENAILTGNAQIAGNHTGYTGTGFVSGLWQAGSVDFEVNAEYAAAYDVKLRYALGFDEGRTMSLYVNGEFVKQIALPNTGSWDTWKEHLETLNLNKGINTVSFKRDSVDTGDINIDSLHIDRRIPWKYQAEEATMVGGAHRSDDHLWYEGTGFAGGFESAYVSESQYEGIKFNVNVPNTAAYTATLRYSGAQPSNITMSLYVNGTKIKQVSLPPTANWDSWGEATETVNLKAGYNEVEYRRDAEDSGCFNIDSLTIDKYSVAGTDLKNKGIVSGTVYTIKAKHSGKALDVAGYSNQPGALVDQWTYVGGNNQRWELIDLGTGYFKIKSAHSGLALDIVEGSPERDVCQTTPSAIDSQQWRLEKVGGYYKIVNKSNGMVMDVSEESKSNGKKVHLYSYVGKANQLWKIEVSYANEMLVPVTQITGVPDTATVGTELMLRGNVLPYNATNPDISWSVKNAGDTGAVITGSTLTATGAGTVLVTAAVLDGAGDGINFTRDFTVTVNPQQPVNSAGILPASANYDLGAGADVSTAITWNDAAAVTEVVYEGNTLNTPEDYVVTESALTIKGDYLAALGLANGDLAEFTINFDRGNPAVFALNIIDSSDPTPVNRSISVESGENGTAYAAVTSAAIGTEVTLTATPDEGYRLREWQVIYPAGLTITGNTFTMPAEAVSVKAIFEPNPAASYTLTVNGSYASGTGAGSYTEGSTVTIDAGSRSNYTFGGWSSGEGVTFANPSSPVTTFTMPAGNVAVTAAWNYSGGSGSNNQGGSGTPVTPVNNYTADIVLPDASGSGTVNAKLPLTINEKTGTAVLDTSANKDLAASGGTSVITVPAIPGVKAYTLSIPVSSLTTAGWEGAVKVNTTAGSITIPSNMLSGVAGAAGAKAEVTIALGDRTILTGDAKAAVGDRPLLELYMSIDGKRIEWNSTAAPVNVSIPYAPSAAELSNPERIIIWYIDDSGKAHAVPNGRYDAATGKVNFTTTHFSHYAVGFNGISFKDVSDTAWYSKAVSYVAARDITSGKGNGSFSPNAKLTRGEFLVMVMKAYGFTPDENAANNFTDAGNTYYTGYLAAAKRLGISGGVGNNMFAPGKEITRQEMFTMLYNALKAIGELPQGHSGKTLSSFEDAGRIAAYAKEAMTYFVEAGIMEGNAGQLTPASTTTRAQLAQVLYNLLSRQ